MMYCNILRKKDLKPEKKQCFKTKNETNKFLKYELSFYIYIYIYIFLYKAIQLIFIKHIT